MSGTLLIDFDVTLVEHAFPNIGKPVENGYGFEVCRRLKEAGYRLILWTCREDVIINKNGFKYYYKYLTEAVNFCKENGVEFDAVNEQLEEITLNEFPRRKPHATWHIDDKNIGGFIGWKKIEELLL